MQRRKFLKALALAAVAPTLMATAEPVAAAIVIPNQKFIDALALFDKAITAIKSSNDVKFVSAEMNNLYAFLMENFTKPVPGDTVFRQQVVELLEIESEESLDSRLRYVPPKLAEMIWPVAAAKSLLSEHRANVAVTHMPAFSEFVAHYKWFIIG